MIITNICLLLEVLSLIFCFHALYGEKLKLDIVTTSFLATYMIIMTMINYYSLPQRYTMIIYPVMFLYCGVRFGFNIKSILINLVFCIIIVGGIQMMASLPFIYLFHINDFKKFQVMLADFLSFGIVIVLLPKCKIYRITNYLQNKEKVPIIVLILCTTLVVLLFFNYKEFREFEVHQAIMLFISIICIYVLTGQMGKYKIKAKEIETELKMHEVYADSFQGLIDNIRLRQHEFDNHINTIYSQHYIYNTYDELIKAQDAYCKVVSKENRFNKLLTAADPILAGFLYGRFMEIDKLGIDVDYHIRIKESNFGVPEYKIVEILGDLINNAVEAMEKTNGINGLYVSLVEDDKFEIEVRNESPFINYQKISRFFDKGFSNKGENRGLGLYNVKNICEEYDLDIYCENINIDNVNWLSFRIVKEKAVTLKGEIY